MGLNDFVRIVREGNRTRIELRNTPGAPEPALTIGPGYITLGGPPADPNSVEMGSLYYDPENGDIKTKGPVTPT